MKFDPSLFLTLPPAPIRRRDPILAGLAVLGSLGLVLAAINFVLETVSTW